MTHTEVIADLEAEQTALAAVLAHLTAEDWVRPTFADRWDVRDTLSHLCYFEEAAVLAATAPDEFRRHADELMSRRDPSGESLILGHSLTPDALVARWQTSRRATTRVLRASDPACRIPWYGPTMGVVSFATARLMETWAHGQDIIDAVGASPIITRRLRHVCHIGVAARRFSFAIHDMSEPQTPICLELVAPDGELWTWGPANTDERITGAALDFALLVTHRRHPDDLNLVVEGEQAAAWIAVAQSFAGRPGRRRGPGLPPVKALGQ